ncbi:MAG: hypothetical protein HY840_02455 [Bacteroidetes bacterium]|nr:hypothetical protein [Bacteroidota bacterium]
MKTIPNGNISNKNIPDIFAHSNAVSAVWLILINPSAICHKPIIRTKIEKELLVFFCGKKMEIYRNIPTLINAGIENIKISFHRV